MKIPINGFGDAIKAVTDAVGIPHCSKCEERRRMLNGLLPFGKTPTGISAGSGQSPKSA
jgi:hypothetical protein